VPIKIPSDLPARRTLEAEGVPVIGEADALHQDIRPLRVALLNLMPDKIRTEAQLARLLGSTPLQVEVTLLKTATYEPRHAPEQHLIDFYSTWEDIRDSYFDGLIVTGAPIETLPFEAVDYWPELTQIFDWAVDHVFSSLYVCWGAQAALHHFHGVPKYDLPQKMFGVYEHTISKANTPVLRGFDDRFWVPVSRHTEVRREDIPDVPGLDILAESTDSGLCLVQDTSHRAVYMFNHVEYDATSLQEEYERDVAADQPIEVPRNYYPNDDPSETPVNRWRSNAHLLFSNWITGIYTGTPYDIEQISALPRPADAAGAHP
jgi:homoserine O-succinyltransferase/O-acetyltransferase